jgi:flavin-dependent dehydrogenase
MRFSETRTNTVFLGLFGIFADLLSRAFFGFIILFHQLGVEQHVLRANFLRLPGYWISWDRETAFQRFGTDRHGDWAGYQAWRPTLDTILLRRAKELGARVLHPCRAIRPILESGRVAGVHTTLGPLHSDFLIDSSGGSQWLPRQLALEPSLASPRLIAFYGYTAAGVDDPYSMPSLVAEGHHWTWTSRVRLDLHHWCQLSFDGTTLAHPSTPEALSHLVPVGPVRGADVTWRCLRQCAGNGFFMAGDSATALDPVSSHGVLRAVMSGMMTAHAVDAILRGRISEKCAAEEYRHWLLTSFYADVHQLRELYAKLKTPPSWLPSAQRL